MIKSVERQRYLVQTTKDEGFVSISEAASRFNTSLETIRRDINKLHDDGLLKKVRGGAAPVKQSMRRDASYVRRVNTNHIERISISRLAAQMITDGAVVALDAGVSIQEIAQAVSGVQDVTFVTNSLPTAAILLRKTESGDISGRVVFIGGEFDIQNKFTRGAMTAAEIDKYYFDIAFISCTSISSEGASSYSLDECFFSERLIKRASRSVLIAESEKIGKGSLYLFGNLADFDSIITDDRHRIPSSIEEALRTTTCKLHIAKLN